MKIIYYKGSVYIIELKKEVEQDETHEIYFRGQGIQVSREVKTSHQYKKSIPNPIVERLCYVPCKNS